MGHGSIEVGVVVTCYSVGFLAGCVSAPRFIQPIGHIRAFSALAAINAVAALGLATTDSLTLWALFRLVGGMCSSVLYTVIESWVADEASNEDRGRVLAIYMIINKVGLIAGQGMLALQLDDPGLFFIVAAAAAAFCIVPVALARTGGPPTPVTRTLSLAELYRIAPVGVIGCLCAGLVNAPVTGLAPLYGLQTGIAAAAIPLMVVAAQIGTMAFQWPLGLLSDRIDRRYVIILATAGSALAALALAFAGGAAAWLVLLLFGLWGGFALSLYAICIAHASDHAEPSQLVALVSSLMLCWAVGSTVGPVLASFAMELFGPAGLLGYAAAVSTAIGLFAFWRQTRRAAVPPELREEFINIPATSPVVGELATIGVEDSERGGARGGERGGGEAGAG
jgi:MFS family permease